jgi:hypothetical protein
MKTMILATAAVLALGVGSAFAGDGDGYSATTLFTSLPGEQATLAQSAPARTAVASNGPAAAHAYVANGNHGTWLFPPDMNGGGN